LRVTLSCAKANVVRTELGSLRLVLKVDFSDIFTVYNKAKQFIIIISKSHLDLKWQPEVWAIDVEYILQ